MIDVSPASSETPVRKARVPELVGVPATDAHDRALDAGVLAVAENATHTAAGRGLICRQHPDPGAEVDRGAIVRIWIGS
ncbi:PASTA domain-containing protein [Actinomycetospora straminea]|uniref:PASTA domain-containing protein n=1 Tax=Actinomycetospora straminea TaxID=663607 RepID=A0ABP9EMP3_9PSEU|nr:PASTA domain-containing protein [Actinomycetospora straminea]MDD7934966.1 PASTA domain-containing protein [Actinomycetospora straminea]